MPMDFWCTVSQIMLLVFDTECVQIGEQPGFMEQFRVWGCAMRNVSEFNVNTVLHDTF